MWQNVFYFIWVFRLKLSVVFANWREADSSHKWLVQAFIHCRLDYCNSLCVLTEIADTQIKRLQKVQNITARLVSGARCRDMSFQTYTQPPCTAFRLNARSFLIPQSAVKVETIYGVDLRTRNVRGRFLDCRLY